jgi:hypothetical protein
MQHHWFVGSLALLAAACMPQAGRLESNRFQHERYPYAVFYPKGASRSAPFGAAWRVENLNAANSRTGTKHGDAYTLNRVYDLNDDGRGDFERLEPRYDLLLENTQQDAAMWLATVPLAQKESDTQLSELAARYVRAVAATGELVPAFGPESTTPPAESTAVLRIEGQKPCSLSKREALRVDASFDQQGSQRAASLTFVRTGYTDRVYDGASGSGRYPVLMVVGIMAHGDKREGLEPDYESLLDHTVLGDKGLGLSLNGEHTCGTDAPSTAPAASSGGETQPPAPASEDNLRPEDVLQPMPADEPAAAEERPVAPPQ